MSEMEGKKMNSTANISQVSGMEHNVRNQGLVACKEKRKIDRNISSLSKDIIFSILLLLPAKVLHEVMRYVCKEWHNMINDPAFISAHHQASSTGIIWHGGWQHLALYVEKNIAGFKRTKLEIPFLATVLGSCHGLVLLYHSKNPEMLHVVNFITKVKVSLPPLKRFNRLFRGRTALSCTSYGHYKVVYFDGSDNLEEIIVCTVGVDRVWRKIDLEGIGHHPLTDLLCPLAVEQFVYWFLPLECIGFALDVDAETIHQFPGPYPYGESFLHTFGLISMERGLGMVIYNEKVNTWVIWELIGLKSGMWTRLLCIDVASVTSRLPGRFDLLAFSLSTFNLRNGELWMMDPDGHIVVCYNLKQGSILSCPMGNASVYGTYYPHVNTLISPAIC